MLMPFTSAHVEDIEEDFSLSDYLKNNLPREQQQQEAIQETEMTERERMLADMRAFSSSIRVPISSAQVQWSHTLSPLLSVSFRH